MFPRAGVEQALRDAELICNLYLAFGEESTLPMTMDQVEELGSPVWGSRPNQSLFIP